MIEKLDPLRDNFLTMVKKHNALVDAVNELQTQVTEHDKEIDDCARDISKMKKIETRAENVQPDTKSRSENVQPSKIICANKRLRKALGIAQTALVKLANDAYDMDEHIYIDKILNQIERITKGGDNE